jgi:heterodisulfide reductase subunit C
VVYNSEDDALELKEAAEICLECGVCCVVKAHSCHAQYDRQFNPTYTYVYDCLSNESPTENPNIWECVSCHKCEEVCPYDVSPLRFIEAMKAKAFEEGNAHPMILGEVENIVSTGFAFPITPSSRRQREQLGLDPIEKKAEKELILIARKTGIFERLRMEDEN